MARIRIIIIGGGFAGVKCARTLRRSLSTSEAEIIVFSLENHMVFHPLLAEVAAAAVNPKDMAAPLRELLKNVHTRTEEVTGIDLANNTLEYLADNGTPRTITYDQLVISSGNTSNLAFIPGMADHAFPLKTVGDALALQAHVINQLEKAEICDDSERKRWYLSFVIVGGGFSGVELAGELNDLVKESARFYTNFKESDVSVKLVHCHDHILPEVGPGLRKFAQQEMEKHGVKFLLNKSAAFCTPQGVGLKEGEFLSAGTVVCTIGSRALPMIERLPVEKLNGRIVPELDMSLPGFKNVWAIGDCAAVKNGFDGKLSPTTGQFAERQGAQVAGNIIARLKNKETKPFNHRSLGTLCSIGGKSAVGEMMDNIKISGFLAWFVWRGVYLLKLPSFAQRIKVGTSWAFDLLFPPALTSLRVDASKRIGNAHYQAGDQIYKPGDPATDFYVIETGEVEVLSLVNGKQETLARLGPGDFFGEGSLLENRSRKHLCIARSDTELLVLGRHIFDQFSKSLAPLKNALAMATRKRSNIWQNFPEVQQLVSNIPLSDLIEPVVSKPLSLEDTVFATIARINDDNLDLVFVTDDKDHLVGLVTKSDLLRAIEVAASNPDKDQHNVKIKHILEHNPIFVTTENDTAGAIAVMRQHGFKRLPVLDAKDNPVLRGIIRIEVVLARIVKELKLSDTAAETLIAKTRV
jgi:NADH dehydrogenase